MLRPLLLVLSLVAVSTVQAQEAGAPFVEGTHYFRVEPPQPTEAPAGKVEVLEVMSYSCPACALFETQVDAWMKRMPANAHFAYLPAAWNDAWTVSARAFFAAESLGVREQTHQQLFDAMHVQRAPLHGIGDFAAWYATNAGVDAATFEQVAESFATDMRVRRVQQAVPRYGVDATPSVVVAGKYRITGESAGSYERLFDVVDYLVAKESAPR
jgi:thiol:disulfide interchange protein DsbA